METVVLRAAALGLADEGLSQQAAADRLGLSGGASLYAECARAWFAVAYSMCHGG